ncbi:MAG: T9SS type A sorting domain-containing protein [Taibaiella sp.]|nr:T9SS type A sorting domain-containing protein [Taibaiella sp.]
MKKTIYILLAGLCGVLTANAQLHSSTPPHDHQYYKNVVRQIQQQQQAAMPSFQSRFARTTTTYERIKAISNYNVAALPSGINDSTRYLYTGGGSQFDFSGMDYMSVWQFGSFIPYGYGSNVAKVNHYYVPAVYCDTALIYNAYYSPFHFYDKRYITYDSNYCVTNFADLYTQDSTTGYPESRFINKFDANSYLTETYTFSWSYGVWDTFEHRIFVYDINHHVIKDSCGGYDPLASTWTAVSKWLYSYNTYGRIAIATNFQYNSTTATWDSINLSKYTYNTDTLLQTTTMYSVPYTGTGPLQKNFHDSSVYVSGSPITSYEVQQSYFDNQVFTTDIFKKHFNALGLPDSLYITEYDSANNVTQGTKTYYTYDSYNNPTYAYSNNIDTSRHPWAYNTTLDVKITYYYETFTPGPLWVKHAHGTGIATVEVQNNMKVYPNPATDEISVELPDMVKGTVVNINIYNLLGQPVLTERLPWMSTVHQVSLGGLIPGTYQVIIQDQGNKDMYRKNVVKR